MVILERMPRRYGILLCTIFACTVFEVLTECKETAAKRRRQSTKLENLGIPEEELLRQQQELFARAREAAALQEMQQEHSGTVIESANTHESVSEEETD